MIKALYLLYKAFCPINTLKTVFIGPITMSDNDFSNLLGTLDISSQILSESIGKIGTVTEYRSGYWKVQYGSKSFEYEDIGNRGFLNESNQIIKPYRGMVGKISSVNSQMVLVCKSRLDEGTMARGIFDKNKKKAAKTISELENLLKIGLLSKDIKTFDKYVYDDELADMLADYYAVHNNEDDFYPVNAFKNPAIVAKLRELIQLAKSQVDLKEDYRDYAEDETDYEQPDHFRKKLNKTDDSPGDVADYDSVDEAAAETYYYSVTLYNEKGKPFIISLNAKDESDAISKAKKRAVKDGKKYIDNKEKEHAVKHVNESINESNIKRGYEDMLSKMSDDELWDETRAAATISIASRGRDNFKANCCLEEWRSRSKPNKYFEAVASVDV